MKIKLFLIFLGIPMLFFSQEIDDLNLLEQEIKDKSDQFSDQEYFDKARSFFLERKWDSTLVYSLKQLDASINSSELNNYCHFFRGYSFYKKSLFSEANKELAEITKSFDFYYLTKMISGSIAIQQK